MIAIDDKLEQELIEQTKIEDIPDNVRHIAELIGVKNLITLSKIYNGDALYIPKPSSLYRKARNDKIKEEYNGYNANALAQKYGVTILHLMRILKGYDPQQLTIEDIL